MSFACASESRGHRPKSGSTPFSRCFGLYWFRTTLMVFHVSHQQADENDCAVVLSLSTVVFRKCAVYVSPSGQTSSFNCPNLTKLTLDLSLALQLRLQRLPRFPCTAPAHFRPQLCRNIAVGFYVHRYQCSPKRLSTTLRRFSAVSWLSPRANPLNSDAVRASLKLLRLPSVSTVTQTTFSGLRCKQLLPEGYARATTPVLRGTLALLVRKLTLHPGFAPVARLHRLCHVKVLFQTGNTHGIVSLTTFFQLLLPK